MFDVAKEKSMMQRNRWPLPADAGRCDTGYLEQRPISVRSTKRAAGMWDTREQGRGSLRCQTVFFP